MIDSGFFILNLKKPWLLPYGIKVFQVIGLENCIFKNIFVHNTSTNPSNQYKSFG